MNTILKISDHPKFPEIKRSVELLPLTIDYRFKIANWPFQIIHEDDKGNELIEVPRANGNFKIDNTRKVNPNDGVKIPLDASQEDLKNGVPEFDFLRAMLMKPDIDPLVLGYLRIDLSDQRGNLNDYSSLMNL